MGQRETIIAQQLQDIKTSLESRDIAKVYQLCDLLKINIAQYHGDKSTIHRIKTIADIAQPSTSNLTLNDRIKEIDDLISILNLG